MAAHGPARARLSYRVGMNNDSTWLRTDELTEAVRSLSVARRHLAEGLTDAYELKWAVLALTWSTQGFIVCSFSPAQVGSWSPRFAEALAKWREDPSGELPDVGSARLPNFLGLCEKLRDHKGYRPDDEAWTLLRELNELRDEFVHFKPRARSIEAAYLRERCRAALDVIDWIIENVFTSAEWPDDELRETTRREVRVARRLAEELD